MGGEDKDNWIIGRALDQVAIGCQHESVSRQHCAISRQSGHYYLTDMGSAHGTFLQGQRLPKNLPYRIDTGAHIKLGVSPRDYVFRAPRAPAVQMTHAQMMAAQLEAQKQAHAAGLYSQGKGSADGKGGKDGKGGNRFRYRS